MRRIIAGILLLQLTGCTSPLRAAAAGGGEQRARAGAVLTTLRGVVTGPAGLTRRDGGALINLDSGSLINLDGGAMTAAQRVGAQAFTLAQADTAPLADLTVVATLPDSKPLVPAVRVRTDGQGRFTVQVPGRGGLVMAFAQGPGARPVALYSLMLEAGRAGEVGVSPASTLVSAPLVDAVRGTSKNFAGLEAAKWQAAVQAAGPAAAGLTPETLADPRAVLRAYEEAARGSEALRAAVSSLLSSLADHAPASFDSPAPGSPRPSASPTASPVATGTPVPPAAASPASTPSPTPTPTPAPEQTTFTLNANTSDGNCFAPTRTPFTLAVGDRVAIRAEGTISVQTNMSVGPAGDAKATQPEESSCGKPLPGQPWGALVYGIGTESTPPTRYAIAGGKLDFAVTTPGPLFLGVNDGWVTDNAGALKVTITVTRATPAASKSPAP